MPAQVGEGVPRLRSERRGMCQLRPARQHVAVHMADPKGPCDEPEAMWNMAGMMATKVLRSDVEAAMSTGNTWREAVEWCS